MVDKKISSGEELQELKDDLKKLRTDFNHLCHVLEDEVGDKLTEYKTRIGSSVHEKAEAAREYASEIGERIGSGAKCAKKAIEEHPFKTAVAALCVGLLIGTLRGRNHD